MSTITDDLAALLATVTRPGDFFTAGTAELLAPSLHVDGVGPIALPLLQVQADALIAAAEPAPYGKGEQTLVDPAVRRSWQIGPDRAHIQGRHWPRTLETIVTRVADGLGVNEPVDAEFYKLLIYDTGSFFIGHRDTEKSPGMFATLVIALPSISTGGELVVRHAGREARLDLRCDDPGEAAFAAFYADCVHEVLPVTAGCRLTLIYNLLRRDGGKRLEPPSYTREQTRVAELLREWGAGKTGPATNKASDEEAPEKLVYPLEHAYTPAELGFAALKGADAAMAGVLIAAAPQADCDLHLALVTAEESGSAEHTGYNRRRRWSRSDPDDDEDGDEFEVVEVFDSYIRLSEWRTPDGSPSALGELPVEAEEFSPSGAFDELEPDEEHFHEATGNEGASFERTYRRAALIVWPRHRVFAVLCQAGLSVTLPYLDDLIQRWLEGAGDDRKTLRRDAHELAGHMIGRWPGHDQYSRRNAPAGNAARMLTLLTRFEDGDLIEAFVVRVMAAGDYGKADNEALLAALAKLPPARQTALLNLIIEQSVAAAFGAYADLVGRAVGRVHDLRAAAARLIVTMPGDPALRAAEPPWRRSVIEPELVVDLLTALAAIDDALADRAVDQILAWPAVYEPDRVLVPAMRSLAQSVTGSVAIDRLRAACLAHLAARIAEPLAPPSDWRRANALTCQCQRCKELAAFLADGQQRIWSLRAVEHDRSHVEDTIRHSRVDLDTATDRHGRPYSLVCTKNQASYQRRAEQRAEDLRDVEKIRALP